MLVVAAAVGAIAPRLALWGCGGLLPRALVFAHAKHRSGAKRLSALYAVLQQFGRATAQKRPPKQGRLGDKPSLPVQKPCSTRLTR